MKRWIALLLLILTACGQPVNPDGTVMGSTPQPTRIPNPKVQKVVDWQDTAFNGTYDQKSVYQYVDRENGIICFIYVNVNITCLNLR